MINSSIGFITQMVLLILQFFCRQIFLHYLSIEYLGISGTFTSLLDTLSLTELGFQTAIVYGLYKPLKEGSIQQINSIINILRVIYKYIGLFFLLITIFVTPFVGYFLSGIEVTTSIYVFFAIQSVSVAISYFGAYRRALLFADQKDYIAKISDTVCSTVFIAIQILVIVAYRDFALFLIVNVFKIFSSNLIVHLLSKRLYPFLHKEKINIEKFREIWGNTKNVFVGKMAAYVYSSTDNLIISVCINTVSVGLIGNYKLLIQVLMRLANGVFSPIGPIIGNLLLEENNSRKEEIFRTYNFIRFLITASILSPTMILINSFIAVWIGEQYVMTEGVVALLIIDVYISLVYSSCCDFLSAAGLFKQDRKIALLGASINFITSIILAYICGIEGVLLGTIISQFWFWGARSYLVYSSCFGVFDKRKYKKYWKMNIVYILIAAMSFCLSNFICHFYNFDWFVHFLLSGITSMFVTCILILILLCRTQESAECIAVFFRLLRKIYKINS